MKAKRSTLYECQHCGWQSSKWLGKCPSCSAWESLIELKSDQLNYLQQNQKHNSQTTNSSTKALPITQVQEEILDRFSSTQSELDIVLGGGIVRGGLYLIGGSPGVGKSTLLLKVAGGLANGESYNIDSNPYTNNLVLNTESSATFHTNNTSLDNQANSYNSFSHTIQSEKQQNLDSNPCHVERSETSSLDSKKDISPFSKARTSKALAHTCKYDNMQNLDSKNYILNPATHPDLTQNLESNHITQKAPHQPIKTENLNSKTTQKTGRKVLYVSGEESLSQIYNRAKRCHCLSDNLYLLSEINILEIKENLLNGGFEVCIIDSIQTIYSPNLTAAPGSVSQVREITFELMRLAKSFNIAMFIIGHITKDGQIAGPRVLEHMVDCVLYFEGERSNELKILRGFKNRFGTTSEIGIFEMKAHGLVSANEATKKFFNAKKDMSGSAAVAIMEGSRCIVVEIQALTCENEYGVPKRLANGFDSNRLNMILALLEKKLGIHLHKHDVFVNVAGGIKISETSADLALIASILSSYKNRPLRSSTAFIGEVSLIGDIREVGGLELRLKELANFGFKNAIVPNIPKDYKGQVKCIQALEVAQIIDWM